MSASGIDPLDYMKMDQSKLAQKGELLKKRLSAAGYELPASSEAKLQSLYSGLDLNNHKDRETFNARYTKAVSEIFGTHKGGKKGKKGGVTFAGEDRKKLKAVMTTYLASLSGGEIDAEAMLKLLSKPEHMNNPELMKRIFGTEHVAKWMDLLAQAGHQHEREQHIREASHGFRYSHTSGTGTITKNDAIDSRAAIVMKGIAFQYDRMTANAKSFWQTMGARGINKSAENMFKGAADFIKRLQGTDPKIVQGLFTGLIGLAALPAAVFAVGAVGSSLLAVGGAAVGAARAFAALNFVATGFLALGARGVAAGGIWAGLGGLATLAGTVGRLTSIGAALYGIYEVVQHGDEIMGFFKELGRSDAWTNLKASFGPLGESVSQLMGSFDGLIQSFAEMMGWKMEGSSLMGVFEGMIDFLTQIVQLTTAAINGMNKLLHPDAKPGEVGSPYYGPVEPSAMDRLWQPPSDPTKPSTQPPMFDIENIPWLKKLWEAPTPRNEDGGNQQGGWLPRDVPAPMSREDIGATKGVTVESGTVTVDSITQPLMLQGATTTTVSIDIKGAPGSTGNATSSTTLKGPANALPPSTGNATGTSR